VQYAAKKRIVREIVIAEKTFVAETMYAKDVTIEDVVVTQIVRLVNVAMETFVIPVVVGMKDNVDVFPLVLAVVAVIALSVDF
tara:strand:- start:84 stop:332 length:249 start_codon:yes stop_codon:yes gene_type:complete